MTPEEFIERLVAIEKKRINVRLMQRRVHKAMENAFESEYKLVNDAEKAGITNIPELRIQASPRLNQVRKNAGVRY